MKKGLLIFFPLLTIGTFNLIEAQSLSNQVRSNYSPGVVSQVFDIVIKTDISESDQIAVAKLIHKKIVQYIRC